MTREDAASTDRRARLAAAVGRRVGPVSRRLHMGEGAVIGGNLALRISPDVARHLGEGHRSVLVSATNGKTTTTRLLSAGVGPGVVTNRQGANLRTGIVAALFHAPPGAPAVLEIDEAELGWGIEQLDPELLVLMNLSRDQLDRHHEVGKLAARWKGVLEGADVRIVANCDDPMVVHAVEGRNVRWVSQGTQWRGDSQLCPRCSTRLGGESEDWWCDGCGFRRPEPTVWLDDDDVVIGDGVVGDDGGDGRRYHLDLAIPGRYIRSNATIAVAALLELDLPVADALERWKGIGEVEGRYRTGTVNGAPARIWLVKNPAGWGDVLWYIRSSGHRVVGALNAQVPDGKDPSWIWDVPFEQLEGMDVGCIGERAVDLAVRLRYAGAHPSLCRDLAEAVGDDPSPVEIVANYSAFRALRGELGEGRLDGGGLDG